MVNEVLALLDGGRRGMMAMRGLGARHSGLVAEGLTGDHDL